MQAAARPVTSTNPLHLPRERWSEHPHFPTQTLLLAGHESFLRTSNDLIGRARAGAEAIGLSWVFRAWKGAMRSHEGYEEYKLYPYLERRWGLSTAAEERGHRQLANCDAAVRDAFAAGPASPRLVEALVAHDAVLREHLALEEQLVIPALLALEPEEFEDYCQSDIRGLLQRLTPAAG